ncbi:protease HtpX [Candidatus Gracilibacteria bacterium]|nr:protease HtpX [Candidatus Gracilibacteria bacterium]
MFKRIILFLLTNIAVIAVLSIVIFIVERVTGISISGYSSSYVSIFLYALIVGFTGSFISLLISRWTAKKAYGVVLVDINNIKNFNPKMGKVFQTVKILADQNHIVMPEVGIYESNDPNAFATGPSKNKSLIAVSSGLLDLMNENEIDGVIGHEMAHILNGDMVTMTLLQGVLNTFVIFISRVLANIFNNITDGKFGNLGYFLVSLVLEILFGILASLIAMSFSRYREFRADEGSARFLGKDKMIAGLRALQKMQNIASGDDEKLATMKISTKKRFGILRYFSSHPDLEDRILRLENLSI